MAVYKYKTKSGDKYMYKVCVNYHQYLKRGFVTKEEAKHAQLIFLAKVQSSSVNTLPTFNELVKQYLERQKLMIKESSYIKDVTGIKCHILGIIPNVQIDKLNYYDFLNWRNCLEKCHLKNFNVYIKLLCSIFDFSKIFYEYNCKFVYMIPPFKDYSFSINNVSMKKKTLTIEDFIKILKFVDEEKFKLLFMTAYITGCRIGEIRGLQVDSLKDNKLFIYQQASSKMNKGHAILSSPKSKTSFRYYLLPEFLIESLKKYIESNGLKCKDFLFSSSRGNDLILGETTLNRRMKDYCLHAGIKPINFHMFRHTEATMLNDAGIDPKVIAKYLGHSSEEVTKKYYFHETDKKREQVAELLENKFKNIFESKN